MLAVQLIKQYRVYSHSSSSVRMYIQYAQWCMSIAFLRQWYELYTLPVYTEGVAASPTDPPTSSCSVVIVVQMNENKFYFCITNISPWMSVYLLGKQRRQRCSDPWPTGSRRMFGRYVTSEKWEQYLLCCQWGERISHNLCAGSLLPGEWLSDSMTSGQWSSPRDTDTGNDSLVWHLSGLV